MNQRDYHCTSYTSNSANPIKRVQTERIDVTCHPKAGNETSQKPETIPENFVPFLRGELKPKPNLRSTNFD